MIYFWLYILFPQFLCQLWPPPTDVQHQHDLWRRLSGEQSLLSAEYNCERKSVLNASTGKVEPLITDALKTKSGQPLYNWQTVHPLLIYCPYISTSEEGDNLWTMDKMVVPNVSIIRRFHCIPNHFFSMNLWRIQHAIFFSMKSQWVELTISVCELMLMDVSERSLRTSSTSPLWAASCNLVLSCGALSHNMA